MCIVKGRRGAASELELRSMKTEIKAQGREYHPHRADGRDRNLRELNLNDFLAGMRCTCERCQETFPEARELAERRKGGKA